MIVRETFIPDRWLFGEEDKVCTSCGVMAYTGELNPRGYAYLVFVEQLDIDKHPWGIPAGKVEHFETEPTQTAQRELEEETGIKVETKRLNEFLILNGQDNKIKIIYECKLTMTELGGFDSWKYTNGLWVKERNVNEIGQMALIPADRLFSRGDPVIKSYYRWDVLHYVKAKLEYLKVI